MAWLLALCVSVLLGYLIGHAGRGAREADRMGLSIALLLIIAAPGFEFGTRAAAPT